MDYFVISNDYPELEKVVKEIFVNVDTVDVISSKDRGIRNRRVNTDSNATFYYPC
jgi:hypothetical protein